MDQHGPSDPPGYNLRRVLGWFPNLGLIPTSASKLSLMEVLCAWIIERAGGHWTISRQLLIWKNISFTFVLSFPPSMP